MMYEKAMEVVGMNLGTANKWIDLMRTAAKDQTVMYDNSQLGMSVRSRYNPQVTTYRSPLGLLADFLNPAGWQTVPVIDVNIKTHESWLYGVGLNVMAMVNITSDLWLGNTFVPPPEYAKRCKIKSDMYDIYEMFDLAPITRVASAGLSGMAEARNSAIKWNAAADWVANNYSNI